MASHQLQAHKSKKNASFTGETYTTEFTNIFYHIYKLELTF